MNEMTERKTKLHYLQATSYGYNTFTKNRLAALILDPELSIRRKLFITFEIHSHKIQLNSTS